jgi:hypothetical protein
MIDDPDILWVEEGRNVIIHALRGNFFHREARENATKATQQKRRNKSDELKVTN